MVFCKNCGNDLRGGLPVSAAPVGAGPGPTAAAPAAVARPAEAAPAPAAAPPAVEAPICSGCGQPGDANGRFCKYCGSALHSGPRGQGLGPGAAPGLGGDAARSELRAQVVVILRDGSEGGTYPLDRDHHDVGSREGDIVLQDDPYLSSRHARIERRGDTFVLLDLGSVNGIYARIREPTPLTDGDMILIGQQVLRFELASEAERQVGPAMQHGVMVFGTPEVPRLGRLVQYTTEGLGRDVYYMHREETVLGREQADVVFADDPFLSRRHAAVSLNREQGTFALRDLGSSNGTAIRCRGERTLRPGDQFRLGRHLFRFDLTLGGGGGHDPQ